MNSMQFGRRLKLKRNLWRSYQMKPNAKLLYNKHYRCCVYTRCEKYFVFIDEGNFTSNRVPSVKLNFLFGRIFISKKFASSFRVDATRNSKRTNELKLKRFNLILIQQIGREGGTENEKHKSWLVRTMYVVRQ